MQDADEVTCQSLIFSGFTLHKTFVVRAEIGHSTDIAPRLLTVVQLIESSEKEKKLYGNAFFFTLTLVNY